MARTLKTKGKKRAGKKKKYGKKKQKKVVKPDMTVAPVTTPEGSVHFDEFLKACRESKLPLVSVKPVAKAKKKKGKKGKKGRKGKKGKKGKRGKKEKKSKAKNGKKKGKKGKKSKRPKKKTEVVKPDKPDSNPILFPLIKALLLPTDGDPLADSTLLPDFVVGKPEPPVMGNQSSIREINIVEQQANKTVDEINKVQENIKSLMEKPDLNAIETVELEEQQLLLMVLLKDFENCLEMIQKIFRRDRISCANRREDDDDDDWYDVCGEEDEEISATCALLKHKSQESIEDTDAAKWYEGIDLTYLLSPNASFDKGRRLSVSSGLLRIFDELKEKKNSTQKNAKRNEVFERLRNKFDVILPPGKAQGTRENLKWVDEKVHKDHQTMLKATNNLKIFQCWDQMEVKYNIVNTLIISLKDAIKSTSPFYYASDSVKSKFVSEQSVLVQALDEFKRKTSQTFVEAGLSDYWNIYPEAMRLGSRPCFDVTIRRRDTKVDSIVPPDDRKLSFLQHSPFITKYENCKTMPKVNSKDSEIEVDMINYN